MREDRQHNAFAALDMLSHAVRNDAGEATVSRSKYAQNIANGTWNVIWELDRFGRATIEHVNTGRHVTIRVTDDARNDAAVDITRWERAYDEAKKLYASGRGEKADVDLAKRELDRMRRQPLRSDAAPEFYAGQRVSVISDHSNITPGTHATVTAISGRNVTITCNGRSYVVDASELEA